MLEKTLELMWKSLPIVIVLIIFVILYQVAGVFFRKLSKSSDRFDFSRQVVRILIVLAAIVALVLAAPLPDSTRGQLLSFLGLLVSAAIALSSTTFLGNIMAGFMLRAFRNFHGGDYLKVGEYFGRVTERGLLHTEIQTEESNLVTLPNLFLATQPVTVLRSSGTIISADLSLGYDVNRLRVEKTLLTAGHSAGLTEPFVQVLELGDFSVTYRVAGCLSEVKTLITARSDLREQVLDKLHEEGIEIVSPNFMNQRVFPVEKQFIPEKIPQWQLQDILPDEINVEEIIFDKAEKAGKLEHLLEVQKRLQQRLQALQEEKNGGNTGRAPELEKEILRVENWLRLLEKKITESHDEIAG